MTEPSTTSLAESTPEAAAPHARSWRSWIVWALIPAALSALAFIVRTALEDKTLQAELNGYKDYAARVRYRLLPGVW